MEMLQPGLSFGGHGFLGHGASQPPKPLSCTFTVSWAGRFLDGSVRCVGKLSRDLRVATIEGVSQGDRSGSKNYLGTRIGKTSCIKWKWRRGGDRREELKVSDSSVHHYTQTCNSEPHSSSLTILMEGVTSGHAKEQLLPGEWEVWGRPCAQCGLGNSAVETLGVGRMSERRRTAWSSHVKWPRYQDPHLKDETESQHLQKSF